MSPVLLLCAWGPRGILCGVIGIRWSLPAFIFIVSETYYSFRVFPGLLPLLSIYELR